MRGLDLIHRIVLILERQLVPLIIVLSLLGANVYRWFPVAGGEPLVGDKIYFIVFSLVDVLFIWALLARFNKRRDKILLRGYLSLSINQLIFELTGDGEKINWQHYFIGVIVTWVVCNELDLKWYKMVLMIGFVLGLLSIK